MELVISIKNRSGTNADASIPIKGLQDYSPGHILEWKPNGWGWSDAELNSPNWRIIRVPNLLASEIESLHSLGDGNPVIQGVKFRKFKIDIASIPANIRQQLNQPGTVVDLLSVVTLAQLRNWIKNT